MKAVASALRILIIDNNPERTSLLTQILDASHYEVVAPLHLGEICQRIEDLPKQLKERNADIILVGADLPEPATLDCLAVLYEKYPCPMVIFSQDERPETIQAATRAGVSAYAVGKLTTTRVRTIIEAAVARFQERQALQRELEETKVSLAERKIIERAKEIVAQQRGTTEAEAYRALRKMAMNRRKRLAEIAQEVLSVAEVLINKQ